MNFTDINEKDGDNFSLIYKQVESKVNFSVWKQVDREMPAQIWQQVWQEIGMKIHEEINYGKRVLRER